MFNIFSILSTILWFLLRSSEWTEFERQISHFEASLILSLGGKSLGIIEAMNLYNGMENVLESKWQDNLRMTFEASSSFSLVPIGVCIAWAWNMSSYFI